MTKIKQSIELIKKTEKLALKYQDFGFHVAFSGGKDSQVIYELCKMLISFNMEKLLLLFVLLVSDFLFFLFIVYIR